MLERTNQKRTLKKVRRHFLNKTPEQPERIELNSPTLVINPPTYYLSSHQIHTLAPHIALGEQNRRIFFKGNVLSQHFTIKNLSIDNNIYSKYSKSVTCHFEANKNSVKIPWEYTVKRLESYGDSELQSWIHMIRNYNINYSNVMDKYFGVLSLDQVKIYQTFRKTKQRAILACGQIEENFPYIKLIHFSDRNDTKLLTISYNQEFLNDIDYSIDDFIYTTRTQGLTSIFKENCELLVEFSRMFLDKIVGDSHPIHMGPEFSTTIEGKHGDKHGFVVQNIRILEPTPEGIFIYTYFVIKKKGESAVDQRMASFKVGFNMNEEKTLIEEIREEVTGCNSSLVLNGNIEEEIQSEKMEEEL